ncbi:proteasome subunit beta, partial [Haematococcus lacustris]
MGADTRLLYLDVAALNYAGVMQAVRAKFPEADMIAAALELHRYGTGRSSRVITAMTMLKQHLFKAIRSGIYNDLGSGSNVDLCVITKAGATYLRNHEYLMDKTYVRKFPVVYPRGSA